MMAASVVHRSQAVLWLCTALLIGHTVTSWKGTATDSAPTRLITAARPLVDRFGVDSLAMVADRLVQANPFRLSRQPAIVPFVADAMLLPPTESAIPRRTSFDQSRRHGKHHPMAPCSRYRRRSDRCSCSSSA